jgi:pimeloyl-ACP methyl ester carboxylesterase
MSAVSSMETSQMHPSVLLVPGIGNSGPSHWQSLWQSSHPNWRRLMVDNWDNVECEDWVSALERQLVNAPEDTLLVAHSLGCLAVAHWAAQTQKKLGGALLVAVPDPASASFPRSAARGSRHCLHNHWGFRRWSSAAPTIPTVAWTMAENAPMPGAASSSWSERRDI